MRALAVLLMAAGFFVLLAGGIRFTRREELARVGHARVSVPAASARIAPRLAGAAMLLAGAALLGTTARRRRQQGSV